MNFLAEKGSLEKPKSGEFGGFLAPSRTFKIIKGLMGDL